MYALLSPILHGAKFNYTLQEQNLKKKRKKKEKLKSIFIPLGKK